MKDRERTDLASRRPSGFEVLSERGLRMDVFVARIRAAITAGLKPAVNYGARSRQDKRGSIPDQLRENRAAAEAEGYAIVATFSDDGVSAYSGNRGPDLATALDVVKLMGEMTYKAGLPVDEWAALWCNDPDRLERGAGDRPLATKALTEVWHEVRRQGVRLRAVYDDDDLVDEAAVGEKSKRSRKYSETLARRTAQGKARRVRERKQSIAPTLFWGYMRVDGKEVPNPETFTAARRVWELGVAGEGASSVSRILAAEGPHLGTGVASRRGSAKIRHPGARHYMSFKATIDNRPSRRESSPRPAGTARGETARRCPIAVSA